jgi:hypothetical protein
MQNARISSNRLERFRRCGEHAYLAVDPEHPDHALFRASYCHDRFCQPCSRARAFHVATALANRLRRETCRLLTLTLRSREGPLRPQLTRLFASFRKLRVTKRWHHDVDGAVAFAEMTFNRDTHLWHPHLHVITIGRFMPHEVYKNLWHDITGDSDIIHMSKVPNVEQITRYVTKYVTKPLTYLHEAHPDALADALVALSGTRLCTTCGSLRGLPLNRKPEPSAYKYLADLEYVRSLAITGDQDAQGVITALQKGKRCPLTPRLYEKLSRAAPGTDSCSLPSTSPTAQCVQSSFDPTWRQRRME